MSHKLGICIPYRNRKEHLDKLIPKLGDFLTKKGIDHCFYVGHQVDDKLFNRGAMKNIAAQIAFEDGCDYIAWHDVDMLPHDDTCDYSYPEDSPTHIATKLSKYSWAMGYDQYFGGVVLFTKEHVEKTNGYSNDYWDWGQEDDDLFWRCDFEGFSDVKVIESIKNKPVGVFNGTNSSLNIPINRDISSCLYRDHTISVLVYSEQQTDKVPIWLVGDQERKFIEYPILRKENAWSWGMSFNNSRAYSMLYFDRSNNPLYHWAKRFERQWSRFTVSYSSENDELYLYMNNQMVSNNGDVLRNKPIILPNKLKLLSSVGDFILGQCTHSGTHFHGKIGEISIYNTYYKKYDDLNDEDLIYRYDFSDTNTIKSNNVEFINEDIEVLQTILPYRREGNFYCLPHQDEGFVNGTWAKGETTARNEKRFVTQMQQNLIDYKTDGINKIKDVTEIINIDTDLYENTKFINVKMTTHDKR